jgi:c-di-AMP phosphodiesterase-like protein
MGAYSTVKITRSHAINFVLKDLLASVDNEMLELVLDKVLASRLYNCRIVPDHHEDNDNYLLD